ncbi:MAG: hypothetical protein GX147_10705 [Deltaproteobacteria bacterium]|nr:hypothetical protein [Deltaproteobacteria bacterium]
MNARWLILCMVLFCMPLPPTYAQEETASAANVETPWILSSSPGPHEEVIGKKPEIRVFFTVVPVAGSITALLDGVDITPLIVPTGNGFIYKPVFQVAPGPHELTISGEDSEGNLLQAFLPFRTRHTKSFEEATLNADVTGVYTTTLRKDAHDGTTPYNAVTVEGMVQGRISEGANAFSFEASPVYVEQDKPLGAGSVEKGPDLRSFLLRGEHTGEQLQARAEFGDVSVDETPFTVQGLLRRGLKIDLGYGNGALSFFTVRAPAIYGVRNTWGLRYEKDSQITGGSASLFLPCLRTDVKATFLTGEDDSTLTYGISGIETGRRTGDIASLRITSQIIPAALIADFEAAYSRYDFDDADEFGKVSDTAWRAALAGAVNQYSYDLKYEYYGRDFESIALQGGIKDREGIYFTGNALFTYHSMSIMASAFWDNVDDLSIMPRTTSIPLALDYSYTRFAQVPMGFSVYHERVKTKDEPAGFDPFDTITDSISGRIGYIREKWNTDLNVTYTYVNDRTRADLDTSSGSYSLAFTLTPTAYWTISLVPNLVQQKNEKTNVRTDIYTTTLDLRTQPVRDLIYWDLMGSHTVADATDDSLDMETTTVSTRLACSLKRYSPTQLHPVIALKGYYQRMKDKVADTKTDEFAVFLAFEINGTFGL